MIACSVPRCPGQQGVKAQSRTAGSQSRRCPKTISASPCQPNVLCTQKINTPTFKASKFTNDYQISYCLIENVEIFQVISCKLYGVLATKKLV